MLKYLGTYLAIFLTMFVIDMVWLGVIAKATYANAMGSLLSPNPNLWAAAALEKRVIAAYHAGPSFLTKRHLYPSTRSYVRKVVLYYHSKVTDLRRSARGAERFPSYSEAVTPSGSMY